MKKAKKVFAMMLALVLVVGTLAACGSSSSSDSSSDESGSASADSEESTYTLNVGAILVGDETEAYTLAHMNGMEAAVEALAEEGITVNLSYKKGIPESDEVETNAVDLIADGCTLIVTNSYAHQYYVDNVVESYPDVTVVAMTGDLAADSGYDNYYNAFTDVFEARYVSGVVAGLKLQELVEEGTLTEENMPDAFDEDGNIKIGYVGAYSYAEVVSGYTAYFLGVQSVIENVAMTVKYTNSWYSEEREAAVAEYLMDEGCVIIAQHADSTGSPAAIQSRYNDDNSLVCFAVGYNLDMIDAGPDVVLTSSSNNWAVYYTELFRAAATGGEIPQDWAEGYAEDAVEITTLNEATVAEGTEEYVETVIEQIKNGELYVFDTSTFTVDGETITSYTESYGFEGNECIAQDGDVYYFDESSLRSAPYFDIRIDGITEIASDYEEE